MKSALPKVLQPLAGRPMLGARDRRRARAGRRGHPRGLRPWRRRRCARRSPAQPTSLGRAGGAARHRPRRAAGDARRSRRRARAGAVRRRAADPRGDAAARCSRAGATARGARRRTRRPDRLRPHRARRARRRRSAIVEQKDASETQRAIRTINTGIIAADAARTARLAARSSATTTRRASTTSPTSSRWRRGEGAPARRGAASTIRSRPRRQRPLAAGAARARAASGARRAR